MYGYCCTYCGATDHFAAELGAECAQHYKAQLDAMRRTAGREALTFRDSVIVVVEVRATARSAHEIVEGLNKRGVWLVRVDKPA